MFTVILAIHIIVAIAMTGLILIQHGKGADAGASFGAGGAATSLRRLGQFFDPFNSGHGSNSLDLALAVHARQQSEDQYRLDVPAVSETTPAPIEPVLPLIL